MRPLLLLALVGCEHGQSGGVDGGGDGPIGDPPLCDKGSMIEGELVDWDSSTASFLGIPGTKISLVGDPSITTTTPPNGRISLCGRSDLPLEFTLQSPDGYIDGRLLITREALLAG